MDLFLAVLLGLLFGFVLQKVGAADPQKIIDMLRLKDLHLMKAILLGIGLSSLLLFALLAAGLVDRGHVSVKASYAGVLLGGGLLGLGWAVSGYCPGTGIVAAGAGRKDALLFVLGGLVGALLFALAYAALKDTALFAAWGGQITLANTGVEKFRALLPALPPLLVAGGVAVVFLVVAWRLPERPR